MNNVLLCYFLELTSDDLKILLLEETGEDEETEVFYGDMYEFMKTPFLRRYLGYRVTEFLQSSDEIMAISISKY